MITEQYVSYEIAILLREKGFNESTEHKILYVIKQFSTGCHWNSCTYKIGDITREYNDACCISIPTLQMAMKWLREEQNLFIEIQCYGCEANEKAHFEFSYVISEYVQFDNKIYTTVGLKERKAKSRFSSYEEACEEAIKYCLENLI